jgi:hypothetical protein
MKCEAQKVFARFFSLQTAAHASHKPADRNPKKATQAQVHGALRLLQPRPNAAKLIREARARGWVEQQPPAQVTLD